MSFVYLNPIPGPDTIRQSLPFPPELVSVKKNRDNQIRAVFEGKDDRFILVIGPCSAHDEDAVAEYCLRLAGLQEKVSDRLILIPRIYTNKPRTTGEGYKGMAHQPDPRQAPDIVEGIKAIRKMHLRVLRESHLSAADEMLYPGNLPYLEDLLSYVTVGARSVENQQHRLTISGMEIPAGMKNPTSGDISVLMNSIHAAQISHVFIYNAWEVKTDGNPLTHAILRGAVDPYGRNIPNYHYENLMSVSSTFLKLEMSNPAIIVDTNHANSNKRYHEQPRIGREVIESRKNSRTIKTMVKGLMVESYLEEGAQDLTSNVFGKSITDPCLGWEDTERFVLDIAETA